MSKRKSTDLFAAFKEIKPPNVRRARLQQQQQQQQQQQEAPPLKGEAIVPETLAEYAMGSPDQIFIARLNANSTIGPMPPMTDVLSYVARLETQPPWFVIGARELEQSRRNYPVLPVLTREYLASGLAEEEPGRVRCGRPAGHCESERLGGFRACALVMPDDQVFASSGGVLMCYLCHLACTNRYYHEARDKTNATDPFVIHRFMVVVNQIGEYKLSMMLPGVAIKFQGLFGPFPIYNEQNYRVVVDPTTGKKRWVESDALVFRLPQAVSPQLGAGVVTTPVRKSISTQFGPDSLSTVSGSSQH